MNIITEFDALYSNNRAIQVKANNPEINEVLRGSNQILIRLFRDEMPWTYSDAMLIENFEFKRYFELLKKYRFLSWSNIPALKSLLNSMTFQMPDFFGLEEMPKMSDFLIK